MMAELTIMVQVGLWLAAAWCAWDVWHMERPSRNRRWTEDEEAHLLRNGHIRRVK